MKKYLSLCLTILMLTIIGTISAHATVENTFSSNGLTIKGVAYNQTGNNYALLANSTTSSYVFTSSDGVAWKNTYKCPWANILLNSITWDNNTNKFIMSHPDGQSILHSTDAITWSTKWTFIPVGSESIISDGVRLIAKGDSILCTTTDFSSWQQTSSAGTGIYFKAVASNGSLASPKYAGVFSNKTYYSNNGGTNWEEKSLLWGADVGTIIYLKSSNMFMTAASSSPFLATLNVGTNENIVSDKGVNFGTVSALSSNANNVILGMANGQLMSMNDDGNFSVNGSIAAITPKSGSVTNNNKIINIIPSKTNEFIAYTSNSVIKISKEVDQFSYQVIDSITPPVNISFTVTDTNNNLISIISANTNVKVKVSTNFDTKIVQTPKKGILIAALYDENGRLSTISQKVPIAISETASTYEVPLTVNNANLSYQIKTFCWTTEEDITPITKKLVFPENPYYGFGVAFKSVQYLSGYNKFIAVGNTDTNGVIYSSTDGENWIKVLGNAPQFVGDTNIVASNGSKIAILAGPNQLFISNDGVNWTNTTIAYNFRNIIYDGVRFIALQTGVTDYKICFSTDLVNWTEKSLPADIKQPTMLASNGAVDNPKIYYGQRWDTKLYVSTNGCDSWNTLDTQWYPSVDVKYSSIANRFLIAIDHAQEIGAYVSFDGTGAPKFNQSWTNPNGDNASTLNNNGSYVMYGRVSGKIFVATENSTFGMGGFAQIPPLTVQDTNSEKINKIAQDGIANAIAITDGNLLKITSNGTVFTYKKILGYHK